MEHGQGSGEGHGKRKQLTSKHRPKRHRGQASYVPSDRTVDEDFVEEQRIDRIRRTIHVVVDSPPHISMFDDNYMRDSNSVFVFIPPHDNDNHKVLNYSSSVKNVVEAREKILMLRKGMIILTTDFGMLSNLISMP
jgi:cellulose biosynthesis protein BcsQ